MITLDVLDTYIVLSKVVVVIYHFIKIIESNIFFRAFQQRFCHDFWERLLMAHILVQLLPS